VLSPLFGSMLMIDIHADDVARYQEVRQDSGAAPKTINLEPGTLRAALRKHRLWADPPPDVRMLPCSHDIGRTLSAEWHVALGDPTNADAILDRLVHHAHEFALTGPSQRGERTTPTKK
jgi:hypothetical protein